MGRYSASFSIGKGTRQGCPLSPLLFAMAIETLAIAIRSYHDINAVACGNQEHKWALYADDLLFFITSPLISTPVVYKILRVFSETSGLRVNMNKPTALNITVSLDLLAQLSSNFDFSWAPAALPYLGIKLTPDVNNLFKANYPPMILKRKGEMEKWSRCGLSWLGRVHAVKMTLLPHLLYLFRSLPIPLTKLFLSKFQSEVIRFVWGNKRYRCLSKTLLHLKSQGGLWLPERWGYYQAANCHKYQWPTPGAQNLTGFPWKEKLSALTPLIISYGVTQRLGQP